jgi:nucleotide-binding universal stress UspA family protein
MLRPTKILVPTDFSKYADKALRQALDIANEYGAEVYLVHVMPTEFRSIADEYTDVSITSETLEQYEEKMVTSSRKKMEKQITRLRGDTAVQVIAETLTGKPEEEIVRFQQEKGADLIVISSLGRSRLSQYLIGSVARGVLKGATCPVLLTK